jgi:hypothetical protein
MISTLFKYVAATAGEVATQTGNVASYVWDDITSIPDAIKQGWDEELFTATLTEQPTATTTSPAQPTPEQIAAQIAKLQAMLPTQTNETQSVA